MPSSRILVSGATGFIGGRLAALALERGIRVRTLTRCMWSGPPDVPAADRWYLNLPDRFQEQAFEGVDAVVHCAVSNSRQERVGRAVNVDGTLALAKASRQAGIRTFIFLSSQSARPDAASVYGRTKYEAEQRLLGIADLDVVILRPGLVTGSGSGGLFGRLTRTVERLPVVPLLGGGRTLVQPIHVDDLCDGILSCIQASKELRGATLRLGDPEGVSLADFLRALSRARLGRERHLLPVPIAPIELVVRGLEALGLRLPISTSNLQGLKRLERMDTAGDLERLGLVLRPLSQMLDASEPAAGDVEGAEGPANARHGAAGKPARVLLVGAGKIALVHAVTLSRLRGVLLCGLVDPRRSATAMLKRMGIRAPAYRSLEAAVERSSPDAAVIATPAATHLPLARRCFEEGLAVLIEKPLAIKREQLDEYRALARSPGVLGQVGYSATRHPHVGVCIKYLRSGKWGRVQGFVAASLISLVQSAGGNRWEMQKDQSGGGAYINCGSHVLAIIRQAFGSPEAFEAQSLRLFSEEVEDSLVVTLRYPGFSGTHYCSWSIDGYPRQENRLVVFTDRGDLVLTAKMGVFLPRQGPPEIYHQLDFDLGFHGVPEFGAAGFIREMTELREAVVRRRPAPMSLAEATAVEQDLFDIYDASATVDGFSLSIPEPGAPSRFESRTSTDRIPLILDLRQAGGPDLRRALGDGDSPWAGYLLFPGQCRGLDRQTRESSSLRVTVPDFTAQGRLLASGRYLEVLREMGPRGFVAAGFNASRLLPREKGATFWVAAMALLAAGLRQLSRGFTGAVLLHGYLSDLALSLDRLDVLEAMLRTCRRLCPRARVGLHTNLAAEAANALRLIDVGADELSVVTSPEAYGIEDAFASLRANAPEDFRITAEVGAAPVAAHRLALADSRRWSHGADALLLGMPAEPRIWKVRVEEQQRCWRRAFPGLRSPQHLL